MRSRQPVAKGRQRRGLRRQRRRQQGGRRRRRFGRHGLYLVAATLHIEGAITATGELGGRDDYKLDQRCEPGMLRQRGAGVCRPHPPRLLRRRHPRRHRHTAGRLHRFNLPERGGRPRQLNGQYTHGTHEYVRTDGSMVIRRWDRRQGDYGWNFCRASDVGSSWSRAITSVLARAKRATSGTSPQLLRGSIAGAARQGTAKSRTAASDRSVSLLLSASHPIHAAGPPLREPACSADTEGAENLCCSLQP